MLYLSLLADFEWIEENTTYTILLFHVPISKPDFAIEC